MRHLTTLALVWAAWTALAVFFAITTSLTYISQGRPPLWGPVLAQTLAQWWIWAAVTPFVVWLVARWPIVRPHRATRVAAYLVIGVVVALGKVSADGAVRQWLFGVRPYLLISNLALQMSIYWALVATAHVLQHYIAARARAARAETRLGLAQLQLLRAQLQPHFLFNALGSIAELVHEDPDRADRMIGRLSDLLRATLDVSGRDEVTLAEELTLLRSYVAIQQTRFGDRLDVVIDVPDDALAARVPFLLLQPLVENAIRHGVGARAAGGRVRISAIRDGATLVLTRRGRRRRTSGRECRWRGADEHARPAGCDVRSGRNRRGDTEGGWRHDRDRAAAVPDVRDAGAERPGGLVMRVVIVDDEALARRRLKRLLGAEPDVEIAAEAADGRSALQAIATARPDAVFLDVQMPVVDGVEVARRLPAPRPAIVFVTAFDHYAVQAFELQAIDYLLKPVARDRLVEAMTRLRDATRHRCRSRLGGQPGAVGAAGAIHRRAALAGAGPGAIDRAASISSTSPPSTGSRRRTTTSCCTPGAIRTSSAARSPTSRPGSIRGDSSASTARPSSRSIASSGSTR